MIATVDTAAFMRAICERPAGDAPRLIFADWLREWGDEDRAQFIMDQIELARYPVEKCDSIYPGCSIWGDGPNNIGHDHKCPMYPIANRSRESLLANFRAWTDGLPDFLNVEFIRGFPAAVTLTSAAFFGGRCERCEGDGRVTFHGQQPYRQVGGNPYMVGCSNCFGTCQTPGLAKRLAESCPLESVRLSDREPWDGGEGCAGWYRREPVERNADDLPPDIFDLLQGGEIHRPMLVSRPYRWYDNPEAARVALSAACVSFGRKLANLPPIQAGTGGGEGE